MRTLLLFCVAALIVGCSSPTEPRHIKHAEELCASNGGLKFVEVHWLWSDFFEVRCNNSAFFKVRMERKP